MCVCKPGIWLGTALANNRSVFVVYPPKPHRLYLYFAQSSRLYVKNMMYIRILAYLLFVRVKFVYGGGARGETTVLTGYLLQARRRTDFN